MVSPDQGTVIPRHRIRVSRMASSSRVVRFAAVLPVPTNRLVGGPRTVRSGQAGLRLDMWLGEILVTGVWQGAG